MNEDKENVDIFNSLDDVSNTAAVNKNHENVIQREFATNTSPLFSSFPRPSEIHSRRFGTDELAAQLESASISNLILRKELSSMNRHRESMCLRMANSKTSSRELETLLSEYESQIQSSASVQIEELMQQQSDHLKQLSDMKVLLSKNKCRYEKDINFSKSEISNLQNDLKTAYKLHRNEINELHDEYKSKDYKPYYLLAQKKVDELTAQIKPFDDLIQTLEESESSRDEFQMLIEKSFEIIKSKLKELEDKKMQMKDEIDRNESSTLKELDITKKLLLDANAKIEEEAKARMKNQNLLIDQQKILTNYRTKYNEQGLEINKIHEKYKEEISSLNKSHLNVKSEHEEKLRNLQSRIDQSTNEKFAIEEELSRAKSHAKDFLFSQVNEINEWKSSVNCLIDKLQAMNSELSNKTCLIEMTFNNEEKKEISASQSVFKKQKSFVSTVLAAVDDHDKVSKVCSNSPHFIPEKKCNLSQEVADAHARSAEVKDSTVEDFIESLSINLDDSLEKIENVFSKLLQQNKNVKSELEQQKLQHDMQIDFIGDLQSELEECQQKVSDLQEEITKLDNKPNFEIKSKEIETDEYKIQENEQELIRLKEQLTSKDKDLSLVNSTLEMTLNKLSETLLSEDVKNYIKEIYSLKKEINLKDLNQSMMKTEMEDTINAAKRRMKKFETNWQKAESELRELDEMVEKIRSILLSHKAEVKSWSEAKFFYKYGLFGNTSRS